MSRTNRALVPRLALTATLAILAVTQPGVASAITPRREATNSREAREDALRNIPFKQFDEKTRQKLARVVSKPTIYRRLPTRVIDCDPDMYVFLVRHPEVVVNIWELMGVTKVQAQRTGPYTMRATDGAGTTTDVELVYGSRDRHVVFAEGYYEGPLLAKKMTGRCVLLLQSEFQQAEQQKGVRVLSQLDVFLQLDNSGIDLLARTLHPIVGRTADHNFIESAGFLGQLNQAAERNPPGMQRLAGRLTQVDPAVRLQFSQVAGVAGQRSMMRQAMQREAAGVPGRLPGQGTAASLTNLNSVNAAAGPAPATVLPATAPRRVNQPGPQFRR